MKRRLSKIAGWFRRNNTIMAQAKDLQRQWQEMRDERDEWRNEAHDWAISNTNIQSQLHRVARERDNERKLRLEALEKIAAWRIIDYEYCYICGNHKDCGHHPECYATQVDEAIRKHKGESDKSDLVAGLEHAVDLYDAIQERKAKENER